jgi:hypothetical protein
MMPFFEMNDGSGSLIQSALVYASNEVDGLRKMSTFDADGTHIAHVSYSYGCDVERADTNLCLQRAAAE